MNEKNLPLMNGAITFAGVVSMQTTEAGVRPWRLPHAQVELFEPGLRERAAAAAGVRLTLVSNTRSLRLRFAELVSESAAKMRFDLLVDGALHQRIDAAQAAGEVRFTDIPSGEHLLEIYLPQPACIEVRSLHIDAHATARPWIDPRPRWVTYGSSITQCNAAAGPSETWPALVANRFGLNLTCLGYGGQCHFEPMVARMIRDLPADYISLCLGINVYGASTLGPRTFRAAVIGLIKTVRDGHPRTPMAVVSPIVNLDREQLPNKLGLTVAVIRETVDEAVALLQRHGDEQLHSVNGLELFGPSLAHHMPDGLHPDAEGYRVLAARYGEVVMPKLKLEPVEQGVEA